MIFYSFSPFLLFGPQLNFLCRDLNPAHKDFGLSCQSPLKVSYNNMLKSLTSYRSFGDHQKITCGKQGGLTWIDRCPTIPDFCILPFKYLFGFGHEAVTVKWISITIFYWFFKSLYFLILSECTHARFWIKDRLLHIYLTEYNEIMSHY